MALHVNCYSKSQRLESDLVLKIVEITFFFWTKSMHNTSKQNYIAKINLVCKIL